MEIKAILFLPHGTDSLLLTLTDISLRIPDGGWQSVSGSKSACLQA
jgi:hypothetical protein